MTSRRYSAIGAQPLYQLWAFFQRELNMSLSVCDTLPEKPLREVPEPVPGLLERLRGALPEERICADPEGRFRAGTGHGLADIWRLRTRQAFRVPNAVVRPESEEEVMAVLREAASFGFAVVQMGGRTNVTSATACPKHKADPRPFVSMDMRGLCRVRWVNAEDGSALIEGGITGLKLKETLAASGVTMGMEPDSMELSTLGGWIATRASGMKRARYGNIEDMVLDVRVATPEGMLWQRYGGTGAEPSQSAGVALPSLIFGSEGCLGVVVSAIVRVRPLPEATEYQSVVFPDWERGAAFMREVARLPAALRPASCRLMDSKQLSLSKAIRESSASSSSGHVKAALQTAVLRARGVALDRASATTLLFEGSRTEVALQMKLLVPLVSSAGGIWGGGLLPDLRHRLPAGLRPGLPDPLGVAGDHGALVGDPQGLARGAGGRASQAPRDAAAGPAVPLLQADAAVRRGRRALHVHGGLHRRPHGLVLPGGLRAAGPRAR
mmetsp:Transcript_17187/g.45502  ORF Transcript_17187/g.45502 Transcript_17187/m.45502 type:complete len:496 (+) Transcript_17187:2500-3987(+)